MIILHDNLAESVSYHTQMSSCLYIIHLTASVHRYNNNKNSNNKDFELKCFILSNILVCLRLSLKIIKYLTGTMKVQLKLGTKPKLLNIWIILKTRVKYLSMF